MHDHNQHGAPAPGLAAPDRAELTHKDEAPRLAGAEGFKEQGRGDRPDCAGSAATLQCSMPADLAGLGKDAATLQARAALLGLVLEPLAGGAWCLLAGTRSAELPSLQAAAARVYAAELLHREVVA